MRETPRGIEAPLLNNRLLLPWLGNLRVVLVALSQKKKEFSNPSDRRLVPLLDKLPSNSDTHESHTNSEDEYK